VVREGVGWWGEMTQALYAHMNNKKIRKNENKIDELLHSNINKEKMPS
jgi:hypothetical protein